MDKLFHPTVYNVGTYSSMLGLQSIRVSKMGSKPQQIWAILARSGGCCIRYTPTTNYEIRSHVILFVQNHFNFQIVCKMIFKRSDNRDIRYWRSRFCEIWVWDALVRMSNFATASWYDFIDAIQHLDFCRSFKVIFMLNRLKWSSVVAFYIIHWLTYNAGGKKLPSIPNRK